MKTITCLVLFLVVTVGSLRADFLLPFADAKVGATVTAGGQIVAVEHKGHDTNYSMHFGTDTGPKILSAEIPASLIREGIAGHDAKITATIREREDAKTKAKARFLEGMRSPGCLRDSVVVGTKGYDVMVSITS